jgi:hypothetical protein
MTPFELHQKIHNHVTNMPCRSGDTFGCEYRDARGNQCAIGCLIPDELYDPLMEGSGVSAVSIINGQWVCARQSGSKRLAGILNNIGIPATSEHHIVMIRWQDRHDDEKNWNDEGYRGPTDYPLE